jgi:hypothetical protein
MANKRRGKKKIEPEGELDEGQHRQEEFTDPVKAHDEQELVRDAENRGDEKKPEK